MNHRIQMAINVYALNHCLTAIALGKYIRREDAHEIVRVLYKKVLCYGTWDEINEFHERYQQHDNDDRKGSEIFMFWMDIATYITGIKAPLEESLHLSQLLDMHLMYISYFATAEAFNDKKAAEKAHLASVAELEKFTKTISKVKESAIDEFTEEAVLLGDIKKVEEAITVGADVNARDRRGHTLLHIAVERGNKEIAELLIAKGADVNPKNANIEFDGATYEVNGAPLNAAAERGNKEIAELLIAKGADVNPKTVIGGTPLYNAAGHGHKAVVELLIAKGADVNAKDGGGKTPLDMAVLSSHPQTVAPLRNHGGKTGAELKAEEK
jgi:hypothetical protein